MNQGSRSQFLQNNFWKGSDSLNPRSTNRLWSCKQIMGTSFIVKGTMDVFPFHTQKKQVASQFPGKIWLVRKHNVLDITVCQQYSLLVYLEKQGLLQSSPSGYGETHACDPSHQSRKATDVKVKNVLHFSCVPAVIVVSSYHSAPIVFSGDFNGQILFEML